MSEKLKARPKFNRRSGKWNIYIEHEGKEVPLGKVIGNGPFFETSEYGSKKAATEYINAVDKLELMEGK